MLMKCIHCGKEFEKPKGSKRIYCSKKCSRLEWKLRNPEKCEEYRKRNLEYMNNVYHKDQEAQAKHKKWLEDNPLKRENITQNMYINTLSKKDIVLFAIRFLKLLKLKNQNHKKDVIKLAQ